MVLHTLGGGFITKFGWGGTRIGISVLHKVGTLRVPSMQ